MRNALRNGALLWVELLGSSAKRIGFAAAATFVLIFGWALVDLANAGIPMGSAVAPAARIGAAILVKFAPFFAACWLLIPPATLLVRYGGKKQH